MSNESQELRLEIFEKLGLKIDENDPIIQLYLIQNAIMKSSVQQFQEGLNGFGDAVISEIKNEQDKVLSNFDEKLLELQDILSKLENQKEAIVADVWYKLQKKIQEQLSKDMQAIANNANNKINNQRNMFIGGVVGLLIGIVFCIILFVFK